VSFEWHEFEIERSLDWSRSFHRGSAEVCLNLSGSGFVSLGGETAQFQPMTAGFYTRGNSTNLLAQRDPGGVHRFLTVELSEDFILRRLRGHESGLHPLIRSAVKSRSVTPGIGPVEPLNATQMELVNSLRAPPVFGAAQRLWFEGKAVELMAHFLFKPEGDEFFCTRQHRLARERAEQVVAILERDLANPPTLEQIGKEVGCSPFYLSRTFSGQMGRTLPQYLRRLRMERAAKLLRSGKWNVTEAALEVGYSSLSHFSSAFHEVFGCCPGLYPLAARPNTALP
jgi:AraC-like DNA-binding protein